MAGECPIDGCDAGRGSAQFMCKAHWRKVPADLQNRVYAAARKMWSEAVAGPAYREWSGVRDEAIAAVELAEVEA